MLSVFDLDHTLVKGNSSYRFCKYLFRHKVFPFSTLVYSTLCYWRFKFHGLSLLELHEKIFRRILQGRTLASLEAHVDAFLKENLFPFLYKPAYECLRHSQKRGDYTVILSNSPQFLVKPIARFFKVNEWGSSLYAVDKDDRLCHILSLMQGEDKARYVAELASRLGIAKQDVTVYSDSYLDLPFLLSAGRAVAVNPDKKLRRYFQERKWNIL